MRCPPGWKLFNGSCFVAFIKPTATWDEARHVCRLLGGDLAKITSAAENTFAYGLISGKLPTAFFRCQEHRNETATRFDNLCVTIGHVRSGV